MPNRQTITVASTTTKSGLFNALSKTAGIADAIAPTTPDIAPSVTGDERPCRGKMVWRRDGSSRAGALALLCSMIQSSYSGRITCPPSGIILAWLAYPLRPELEAVPGDWPLPS